MSVECVHYAILYLLKSTVKFFRDADCHRERCDARNSPVFSHLQNDSSESLLHLAGSEKLHQAVAILLQKLEKS